MNSFRLSNDGAEFKLSLEMLQALLQGKKVQFEMYSPITEEKPRLFRVVIHPPQGQISMTYEEFEEMKRSMAYEGAIDLIKIIEGKGALNLGKILSDSIKR